MRMAHQGLAGKPGLFGAVPDVSLRKHDDEEWSSGVWGPWRARVPRE
jgi:hypothetical protein